MRSYYVILGVPVTESTAGIRAAYRDRAKALHPDHAGGGREREFRELQEAYEVLSDPKRRRRYDAGRSRDEGLGRTDPTAPRPHPEPMVRPRRAEPMSAPGRPAEGAASLFRDFQTIRPSRDALRERVARNFSGRGAPKAEHAEALTVELDLSPEQAARGVRVPLGIPVFRTCPECGGEGTTWGYPCVACDRQGLVEDERIIGVDIPPGVRTGAVAELPLDGLGIDNLYLRVLVRVTA